MATTTNGNGNLVDEFEEAFQSCLSTLTKEDALASMEKEEIRNEVDNNVLKFIDLARQMEAFFLQKRFLLSALKPELIVKEDINDLRTELMRKEELIKRHHEKIGNWQNLLADLQDWAKSPATTPSGGGAGGPGPQSGGPLGPQGQALQGQGQALHQVQVMQTPAQVMQAQVAQQQQLQQQMQAQMQQQMQIQQQMQQMQGGPGGMGGPGMGGPGMAGPGMAGPGMGGPMAPGAPPPGMMMGPAPGGLHGPLAYLEKTTSNIGGVGSGGGGPGEGGRR